MALTNLSFKASLYFERIRYKPFWIFILALVLYLLTLSRHYTGGSIEFAIEIESGEWIIMLQRHKMLVHPMGWVFLQMWRLAGWSDKAIFPLQVFNALAGAVTVAIMFHLGERIARSAKIALLITFGFAVSCAVWLYSTEAEFVTPPLAEMLIVLAWLVTASPNSFGKWRDAAKLGLGAGIAILTFLTNIIIVPMVLINFWLTENQPLFSRLIQMVRFLIVLALVVVPPYLFVMYLDGVRDLQSLVHWRLYGGQGAGNLYGTVGWQNLAYGGYAFLRTFASFPGLGLNDRTTQFWADGTTIARVTFGIYYLIAFTFVAIPFVVAFVKRHPLLQAHRRILGVLVTWTILQAGFSFYWVPKDLKFWFPILVPWWLLVGMLLATPCPPTPRVPAFFSRLRFDAFVLGLALALLCINAMGLVLPHRVLETNRAYGIALNVRDQSRPQDLLITTDDNRYIPYFTDRETISLLDRFLHANGDRTQVFIQVDRQVAQTRARGGQVYLIGAQPGQDVMWDALQAAGLTRADLQHFITIRAWSVLGEDILEIVP